MEGKAFDLAKFAIFMVFLLSLTSITLVYADQMEIIDVAAGDYSTFTIDLQNGQRFHGSMAITGGSENDIDFLVKNPVGDTILNLGRVTQETSFEFTADRDGTYILNFANDFSIYDQKTVTLTFDTCSSGTASIDTNLILAVLLGYVVILTIGILVFRYFKKTKEKKS